MAKRALSWKRAGAIGWRDLRSAPGKFGFVVLSVAVGVAALVGVRGFSESFRRTLSTEARSLMAGDLTARLFHQPTAEEKDRIAAIAQPGGIRTTWETETVSMASAPPDPVPLLVSLKAVDPAEYPYYGTAELEPAMSLQQALDGDSAVVAEEFLIRLNAQVGQTLRLGGRSFRIAAVLKQEPDRLSAGAGLGPRVMISQAALERTGLLAPGSRASQKLLMKLPPQADPVALRKQVETALPDAQVMDFREGNPGLNRGLDNATAILSLICLVAMVLGAIGVAMAMHAHLEQRMDMLAILKAVGASSSDLLRIFLLQTLGLGLAGGLVGVAAGVGVMAALPAVFGKLLPVHTMLEFPWRSIAAGLGTGLLTTLLFCLPPLLDVRNVRPVLVLRRLVEQGPEGIGGWFARWWARRLQLGISCDGDCRAERNRLGVVGLSRGGRLVCADLHDCAGGATGDGGCGAAHVALPAQPRPAAAAFLSAAWAGESLPAGKSVGSGAGRAGHGRDADPGGLPDAGDALARHSRDSLAQTAQYFSCRCDDR
jgi:putative ABC transport system permease protein